MGREIRTAHDLSERRIVIDQVEPCSRSATERRPPTHPRIDEIPADSKTERIDRWLYQRDRLREPVIRRAKPEEEETECERKLCVKLSSRFGRVAGRVHGLQIAHQW